MFRGSACCEVYRGSEAIEPLILNITTVVSFTPRPLYLWAGALFTHRRGDRVGLPRRSGNFGEEKSLAAVGIHYMDKMHKMQAFVAS